VKFGPAPPSIPAGAELAVLHGDPGKKGPYVMRLRLPDGYRLPPHWHSQQEHLTVLEGTFNLGMGDKIDEGSAKALSAGGFHYIAARQPHYAFSKGVTVLQVHGMGPFDIHYLEPKDDPRHGAAATK
jgi:quercetin dioxygenase-like cupin family protein